VRFALVALIAAALAALPVPSVLADTTPDTSPPPGALNPNVTQSNIAQTICRPGWTATVRPPESYTYQLKRQQMAARRPRNRVRVRPCRVLKVSGKVSGRHKRAFGGRRAGPGWRSRVGTFDERSTGVKMEISVKSKMNHKVVEELNRQLNQELAAAHSYLALSVWCDIRNFKGFGQFFVKQAGEERGHAERILKHLTDRGETAKVAALPAPKQDFQTLLEVARHVQSQEHANTLGVNAVYEAALEAKDYPAQVLMHWFIDEQVEEEDWSTEMVERTEAATSIGGLSYLDRHIERYLEQEVREVPREESSEE
jgi:ferritin